MPPSVAATADALVVAAPEWPAAVQIAGGEAVEIEPHAVFDHQEILSLSRWNAGMPRRLLAITDRGVVEVASLGREVALVVHSSPPSRTPLPRGTYAAAAAHGDLVYLVASDRNAYRSQVVTVQLTDAGPAVIGVQSFSGVGAGAAVDGDRLYVADADRGVRVFARTGTLIRELGVVDLEVAP
jgi:hypothetical protein